MGNGQRVTEKSAKACDFGGSRGGPEGSILVVFHHYISALVCALGIYFFGIEELTKLCAGFEFGAKRPTHHREKCESVFIFDQFTN